MSAGNFWEIKTLEAMSHDEWESLCDGCGICCLVKIEDEDSAEVFNTTVSCKQLNIETCRCKDYDKRLVNVSMCIQLTLKNLPELQWLPDTCAYKLLYKKQSLPLWHPLLTNDSHSVHEAGVSAKWFAQSEEFIHPEQLADFVIHPSEK